MKARMAIGALSLSAAALVSIFAREGYTDRAVIPTKGDVPTVDFGTTVKEGGVPVRMGDTTNPVQAAQRSLAHIQKDEGVIKQCVKVPLSQAEYDVYVDLAYNIGAGAFCGSTIVKRLNAENYAGACEAILMWRYAAGFDCATPGNKRCAGLWTDRQRSHANCQAAQ